MTTDTTGQLAASAALFDLATAYRAEAVLYCDWCGASLWADAALLSAAGDLTATGELSLDAAWHVLDSGRLVLARVILERTVTGDPARAQILDRLAGLT